MTHFEAFGKVAQSDLPPQVSVKIKQHGLDGSELIWEKLPIETELIIPAGLLVINDEKAENKAIYAQYLGNIASFTAYYGGILVSIPLGALVSMELAAKLGAALAPSLLPHLALKVGGYNLFNPLHYFGSGFIGVIGGYAVGAVTGALLLPLAFSVVYKGGAALISYCVSEKEKPALRDEGKLEDSWIYLPNIPVEGLLDDWIIVGEEELPQKL